MKEMKWLILTVFKSRPLFLLIVSASYILLYLLTPLSSFLIKLLTDHLTTYQRDIASITIPIFLYVLVLSFSNIQYSLSMVFIENIDHSLSQLVQNKLFIAIQRVDFRALDQAAFGNKLFRAKNSTRYFMTNVLNDFLHMFGEGVSFMISLIVLWKESLCAFMIVAMICVVKNIFTRKHAQLVERKDQIKDESLFAAEYDFSLLTDRKNIKEIRTYQLNDWIFRKWKDHFEKACQAEYHFQKRVGLKKIFLSFISLVLESLLLIYLATMIIGGEMTLGSMLLIAGLKDALVNGMDTLTESIIDLHESVAYLVDLREILEIDDSFAVMKPTDHKIALNMEHVCYQYDRDRFVLFDISSKIAKGEIVALVGENGSGKSTFAKVALGLLKASSGKVENLSEGLSAAFQDFSKYQLSFRENIGFGALELICSDEEIKRAVRSGDAEKVLERLDNQLDIILGKAFDQSGTELSGGEWQKIAIARSFMKKNGFFVFDEPTSALDPIAELKQFQQIVQVMKSSGGGLMISHRVGIARLADKILFLSNGRIVEEGTHEHLMKERGQYFSFFKAQSQWYEDKELKD